MKKTLLFIFFIAWSISFYGQNLKDTIISIPFANFSYSPQIPGGDLAKRFGFTNNIGINIGIKTAKNWQFELEGNFLFSKNIREKNILSFLQTSEGYIIDQYGDAVNVLMYQRGFTESFMVGKLFPVIGPNQNSGIMAKFGIGFMHHKIKIENQDDKVPALTKDNLVYVDRLTMGLALKQYIGYQHFGDSKLMNFNLGLEITEGFTQGMRDYQFGYGEYREYRTEFLIGLRLGWLIPVYRQAPAEYYID